MMTTTCLIFWIPASETGAALLADAAPGLALPGPLGPLVQAASSPATRSAAVAAATLRATAPQSRLRADAATPPPLYPERLLLTRQRPAVSC